MLSHPPRSSQDLLRQSGLRPKKSWGQNFLTDENVLRDIAAATGAQDGEQVVELGAGLGALTYHLIHRGARVVAVERDRDLVPVLQSYLGPSGHLEICEADAARFDYAACAARLGSPLSVAGNLPYQLSGRILVSLADAGPAVRQAVLLVQREVADRLAAPAGSRTYGLLSVLVQRTFSVERVFVVPPGAFHPAPKVYSAVVRLRQRPTGRDAATDAALVAAARAGFSARRKTLRNALSGGLKAEPAEVEAALLAAGIAPSARAETLTLADFARLGSALVAQGVLVTTLPEVP